MSITGMVGVVFDPLLGLPLFLVVVILSFLITLLTTLIYKWTTNQSLMKSLKDEIKSLQGLMKEAKSDPDEAMKLNQKLMAVNSKYFMQSMKPLFYTMLPILLIFGWMQASLAFDPLVVGEEFDVLAKLEESGEVNIDVPPQLTLTSAAKKEGEEVMISMVPSKEGLYPVTLTSDKQSVQKEVRITQERKYETPVSKYKGPFKTVTVVHQKAIAMNLFGWKLGWLGTYIIFSIVFSTALRKLLKVY